MRPRIVLSVVFLAAFGLTASAQNRSTVTGYVFGPGRAPVERAQVELRNDVNSVIGRTWTEPSGRYSFRAVPSGRLSVHVMPVGTDLSEQTQDFEISGIGVRGQLIPENVQLDFHLRPRRTTGTTTNAVVFAQDVPDEAKRIFDAATADLESGRTDAAVEQLKKSLAIFPTYFLALDRLGAAYMKLEKYGEAREIYARATAVNDKSFPSWYGLAYTDYSTGKYEDAIAAADRALTLDKNSAIVMFVSGLSHRRLKRYERAEKMFLGAKKLDNGQTPAINWNLALLYTYNLKKYQAAADELELYLKATPEDPNADKLRKLIKDLRENRPPPLQGS